MLGIHQGRAQDYTQSPYTPKLPPPRLPPRTSDSEHDTSSSPDATHSGQQSPDSSEGSPTSLIHSNATQVQQAVQRVGFGSRASSHKAPSKLAPTAPRRSGHDSTKSSTNSSVRAPQKPLPSPSVERTSLGGSQNQDIQSSTNRWNVGKSSSQVSQSKESVVIGSRQTKVESSEGIAINSEKGDTIAQDEQSKADLYHLREATAAERQKIEKRLGSEFTKKFKVNRIQKLIDPDDKILFDQIKHKLKKKTGERLNTPYVPVDKEYQDKIVESIEGLAKREDNLCILTAFHGAKKAALFNILEAGGLQFMGTTDDGYFGHGDGPYLSTDAQYCALYGGDKGEGVLFAVKTVWGKGRCFPIPHCEDYNGKPIKSGFQIHAARVKPKSDRDNEMVWNSSEPWDESTNDKRIYHEVVVGNQFQARIKYAIEYTLNETYASHKEWNRDNFRESISDYLDKFPSSDLFIVLSRLLDEIENDNKPLLVKEKDLFAQLKQAMKDDGLTRIDLAEVRKFLHDDFNNPVELPPSYLKEQEKQEAGDKNLANGDVLLARANNQTVPKESRKTIENALKEYKIALRRQKSSFKANLGCGRCHIALQEWDKALPYLIEARKIKPFDVDAIQDHVTALTKTDHYVDAAKLLWTVLEKHPLNDKLLSRLSMIYLSQDAVKKAYRLAAKALSINPANPLALRVRGIYYYHACFDTKLGVSSYEKVKTDLMEPKPLGLYYLARLYIAMNCAKEAQLTCEKLLSFNPHDTEGLLVQAKIALMQGNIEKALEIIGRCENAKGNEFAVLSLRGEICLQQNKLDEALEHFNNSEKMYQSWLATQVLRKNRIDYYYILISRAEVHHRLNNIQPALADLEEAIKLFPNRSEAFKCRANLYTLWKKKDEAQADRKKADDLESALIAK